MSFRLRAQLLDSLLELHGESVGFALVAFASAAPVLGSDCLAYY